MPPGAQALATKFSKNANAKNLPLLALLPKYLGVLFPKEPGGKQPLIWLRWRKFILRQADIKKCMPQLMEGEYSPGLQKSITV